MSTYNHRHLNHLDVVDNDDEDLQTIIAEHRRELTAAQSLDNDIDYAFHLQLQEAITASLSHLPSTSTPPPPPPPPPPKNLPPRNDSVSLSLQSNEISRLEQELTDVNLAKREFSKQTEDVRRRIHDQHVAREILHISEPEWLEWGDQFEKPFFPKPVGSSSSVNHSNNSDNKNNNNNNNVDDLFKLYFKGLVSEERVGGERIVLAGIGVAVCDPLDHLLFEIRKPLIGSRVSKIVAEAKALIEGLNAVASLELKRVVVFCDCYPLYQFVSGRWPPKQRKVVTLVNQVALLQRKFTYCKTKFVARNDIKYAFKLARDAVISQATSGPAEVSHGKAAVKETCIICLEDTDGENMFSVDVCQHRFCFSCMKQHVEVKLLHGMLPKCPHENCKSELEVESCKKFLTPKLIETMTQRIKEASIPVTEKIYCPYPRCSALMSKKDINENSFVAPDHSSARKCLKCHGLFCINCKVPWHSGMTCSDYKKRNPNLPGGDVKLKSLATRNLWRQCVKCNHMIELAEGCYHMTCRCGYEFCYNCGAEWKNKAATCSCPLWDEDNIWFDDREFDDDDDDDEDDEFDEDEYEYDELYESDSSDIFPF